MAKTKSTDLSYYRSLPYTRRLRIESGDGGEYFVASVAELAGVEADGESRIEALFNLQSAFDDAVEAMLEWDHDIPEPDAWPGADFVAAEPTRRRRSSSNVAASDAVLVGEAEVSEPEREYQLA